MVNRFMLISNQSTAADGIESYMECVGDLLNHDAVLSMKDFSKHGDVSCLEHCLYVSYVSYRLGRRLGLDARSLARGGLLHDFYLYDWHVDSPPEGGLHGFVHPRLALKNAERHFKLSAREKDIILKHMWPLTPAFPSHRESFVVSFVDKYCALVETLRIGRRKTLQMLRSLPLQ